MKVIPIKDIVWVYQEEGNGAASGVKICTVEGERFTVPVMTKGKQTAPASRYLLRLIARKNKGVFIGYKQEYVQNNYYEKDFR